MYIKCRLCNEITAKFILKGKDRLYHIAGSFDIYRCNACGLIFIYPPPDETTLNRYYPRNYYSYFDSVRATQPQAANYRKIIYYLCHPLKGANAFFYSKLMRQNLKVSPVKCITLLDVGCGDGKFLIEQKERGFVRFGVDINRDALKRLKEKDPGITTYCGNLWEAGFDNNMFDFINLSNVMEHIYDYDKLLQEINRIIKKGGVVRIQVPNAPSLTYSIFGKYWIGLDVPRHFYIFSPKNLKIIFKKYNLRIIGFRTIENSYDFIVSVIYIFSDIFKSKPDIMRLSYIWDSELIKLLFTPYALLVNSLGIGDSAEYLLQKV